MNTPSFKEDHISQIPALQMLQKVGCKYLSPAETGKLQIENGDYLIDEFRDKYHLTLSFEEATYSEL